jgi:glycosyltransferase involved in cell wall biosynthesis
MPPNLIMFQGSIIHVTKSIGREAFGVATVATKLPQAQADLGMHPEVWVMDGEAVAIDSARSAGLSEGLVRCFPQSPPSFLGISFEMERAARSWSGRKPLVVHQHMLWLGYSRTTQILARHAGARTVIAPHGVLDYWHVRKSRLKKRIAGALYENANLASCDCLQALSDQELKDFRDYGLRNPVARINNGVTDEQLEAVGNGDDFRSKHEIAADRRIMLFFSRISPQKGLDMLLRAMDQLRGSLGNWLLVVCGHNQDGHESELRKLATDLQLDEYIVFAGPIFGDEKNDAFAAAEVFVLPSRSEGAPMVVLEAMAAGLPVMTTKAAPWEDLLKHKCGWWGDISVESIRESLSEVLASDASRLKEMGCKAKQLVAKEHTWSVAARRSSELYQWLCGESAKPDFVTLD